MHGVTARAGNAVFVVRRAHEFALLKIRLVAGHAALRDLVRLCVFEVEDFGLISASRNVRRSRSMAIFAAMDGLAPNLLGGTYLEVRTGVNALACVLMTTNMDESSKPKFIAKSE